jgi:osmotically-inducible protein OsmY
MRKLALLLCLSALPLLNGCFPLVVAGAGASALSLEDRRTSGAQIEDNSLESKISWRIGEHYARDTHVDVTSFNRNVVLAGQVLDEAAKQDIERIARSAENVKNVYNELTVGPAVSAGTHSNDAYLTSKVKGRFLDSGKFYPNHVKVMTENSVVYLLGLVKHKEAEDASEIASTTSGVNKVVRLFEYID